MRITIRLDERLLANAKKMAAASGRSLTAVVEDALRKMLNRSRKTEKDIKLPVFKGRGLRPGVNLDSSAALLAHMDQTP